MIQNNQSIFKSNGYYLGFIQNSFLFSRDGIYLGWIEGQYVWDAGGKFRGMIVNMTGHNYILLNQFVIPPLSKSPKAAPGVPSLPLPEANIPPVNLPIGWVDAF